MRIYNFIRMSIVDDGNDIVDNIFINKNNSNAPILQCTIARIEMFGCIYRRQRYWAQVRERMRRDVCVKEEEKVREKEPGRQWKARIKFIIFVDCMHSCINILWLLLPFCVLLLSIDRSVGRSVDVIFIVLLLSDLNSCHYCGLFYFSSSS